MTFKTVFGINELEYAFVDQTIFKMAEEISRILAALDMITIVTWRRNMISQIFVNIGSDSLTAPNH